MSSDKLSSIVWLIQTRANQTNLSKKSMLKKLAEKSFDISNQF